MPTVKSVTSGKLRKRMVLNDKNIIFGTKNVALLSRSSKHNITTSIPKHEKSSIKTLKEEKDLTGITTSRTS